MDRIIAVRWIVTALLGMTLRTLTLIRRNGDAIAGASWTGTLAPDEFVEFGIKAVNPAAAEALTWRFIQSYADGTKVEWTGAPGSKTPAPQVVLRTATAGAPHHWARLRRMALN